MDLWWVPLPLAAEEVMTRSFHCPREKLLHIVGICVRLRSSLSQQREEAHAQV